MFKTAMLALAFASVGALELTIPTGAALIPDKYIVTLRSNVSDSEHSALAARLGGPAIQIHNFRAVTAGFDAATLQWVLQDERVEAVEQDSVVQAYQTCQSQTTTASWGQVRTTRTSPVGIRNLPYQRVVGWGANVNAYVLDTGIRCTHQDFSTNGVSRCAAGATFVGTPADSDPNGHGTHCASTIGGTQWGVAQSTSLFAVKVLSDTGSGAVSGIVGGVEWANDHRRRSGRPGVLSMSLGGGVSAAMDAAVNQAVQAGSHVTVASGNSNANACNSSPARATGPVTVSSTELVNDNSDRRSTFSNWGTCVDIFAPGTNIVAASSASNTGTRTLSGTSMACPHVAGALAAYLTTNPSLTPAAAKTLLNTRAVANVIADVGTGSPNRLVHIQC